MEKTPARDTSRKLYTAPHVRRWGTVADLTTVGRTVGGSDVWPEGVPNFIKDQPGSIIPGNG